MTNYNDFQLDGHQIDAVKKMHQKLAIMSYIKEHGSEPSDISEYYTATEDELELYKRAFYAKYVQNIPQPKPKALKFTANGDSTLGMTIGYNIKNNVSFSYSTDGKNWSDWAGETLDISDGKSVYIKGDNPNGISTESTINRSAKFTMTGSIACEGNIQWLLGEDIDDIPSNYCYYSMFNGCTSLTTAPELPATTLTNYCYYYMFQGCTNLTTAPELPATTLANYCYYGMFQGCTNLTTAPELPATTLANYCYGIMFQGCTNLTTAPELPGTTLTNGCYGIMFKGCTNLTTAPALPATTLTDSCYSSMFNGCTNLNSVKCLATDITAKFCTSNWLFGVASTGTFTALSTANWTTDANGIPNGWTRVDA